MTLLLPALLLSPLLGAAGCALRPSRPRRIAQASALLTALLAAALVGLFDARSAEVQFPVSLPWIADLGVNFALGLNGVSLMFVALTAWITPAILHATGSWERGRSGRYLAWMLALEGLTLGAFAARDGFLFLAFWDLQLIPVFFLVGIWGGRERVRAALRFVATALVGSGGLLLALLVVLLGDGAAPEGTRIWVFVALTAAFAARLPLFPLHTWLPELLAAAPTGAAALLAATALPLSVYGYLNFSLALVPEAAAMAAPWMVGLAAVGALHGAAVALGARDVRLWIAYAATAQAGVAAVGLFSLDAVGALGASLLALSLGLTTSAALLLAGMLHARRGTWSADELGGLARVMPRYAGLSLLVTLAAAGLPGLSAFPGVALTVMGAARFSLAAAAAAVVSVGVAGVALLLFFQRVHLGPLSHWENRGLRDLSRRELLALAPLVLLILLLGMAPGAALDRMAMTTQSAMTTAAPEGTP